MGYMEIIIGGIFVNNILLAQFLGNCPFLGTSKKMETAVGMAMAVVFVLVLAGVITWVLYTFFLVPYKLVYMRTIAFILVIASLVQFVEICAVFGACILNVDKELNFMKTLVQSVAYAVGFGLALILFAGVRERIILARVPKPLQDTSIGLVTAGILSLTFYAFKGMI
ncbi:MAG: electron transport complex subunit RsxA [Deltaproteobacteria bacterium]|nr:electron transport complex subunit RsxA [Deltaproteobacteria bacterium]